MDADELIAKNILPESGFVRLSQILGNKRKGIPAIIPISRSSWYSKQKLGLFPKPVMLTSRCACYRVEDIRAILTVKK
jgi:prophage regulatory protein